MSRQPIIYSCPHCKFEAQSGITTNRGVQEIRDHMVENHDSPYYISREEFLREEGVHTYAKICKM